MTIAIFFVYGFWGAFVVDFQKVYSAIVERNLQPMEASDIYWQRGFWIFRVLHAMCGGFLAVAWGQSFPQTTPLTLMAVGGAAGLIVHRFGLLIARKF